MLSNEAQRLIINDVKEAPFYSVMAYTTPDISHKDCLAICVRYPRNGEAVERLLEVAEGKDKTGLGTGTEIIDILTKNSLCTNNLAFQSYDYASNMSGSINGAQANVSKIVGHNVIYIPCQAHRINTFIEHGCNSSLIISNMIDNLESLYVFFSASNKRYSILCKEMSDLDNVLQLRNLSKTRWTARAESIKAVWCSFEAICDSLHYISSHQDAYDRMTRTKAHGLNKKLHSFNFIVSLIFMKNIMYKLKALTETLETKHLSLVDAATLIGTTIKILEEINLDTNSINNLIDSAISFSTTLGINPENDFKIHHRHKKPPTWLDKNSKTQAKCKDAEAVQAELEILRSLEIKPDLTTANIFEKCEEIKHILPLAKTVCDLALTAPVSVATNERTFSKLKLIKTHLGLQLVTPD
ncbi:uncharacterized protein LOC132953246 [Metopolophium dirhodum]|uniref:uncharacterized protein LOC132953246 n=1 Tax=Metopolophium dirhodum TaxID=44670 RepID=UPI00298FC859|nr:uncharacterized protein LOC132953246 [Metopolophium dirhodum]